ncbi:1,2-dihydroxy-3-keto-5-methylthiopentene dioxygenase [Physcia stellaris]|nr:1,2-dihydroxy-3-keto-5-methylthiopentene dioxygenase [Physcia stellaris]
MKIYYHDGKDVSLFNRNPVTISADLSYQDDPRLPHQDEPPLPKIPGVQTQFAVHLMKLEHEKQKVAAQLSPDYLTTLGIIHHHWSPFDDIVSNEEVDNLAKERNYIHRDTIDISRMALGTFYDDKIATFYEEHMHEDEEVRWIRSGSGYFDVRDAQDRWVRISLEEGDLLVLPAGLYHRFTVDMDEGIIAERFFQTRTGWTALKRSEETEKNSVRIEYLRKRAKGFSE